MFYSSKNSINYWVTVITACKDSLNSERSWRRTENEVDQYICSRHPSEGAQTSERTKISTWQLLWLGIGLCLLFSLILPQLTVPDHSKNDNFEARKNTVLAHIGELEPKLKLEEKRKGRLPRQILSMARYQRSNPPDEPLVWLLMAVSRLRNEAEKFALKLAPLARGQTPAKIDARNVSSATEFESQIMSYLSKDKSLIVQHLNSMKLGSRNDKV